MSKIIGVATTAFTGKDGTSVEGATLYIAEPIEPHRGKGDSSYKLFLSASKLAALSFHPTPGQEVDILYNRYGKAVDLTLVHPEVD